MNECILIWLLLCPVCDHAEEITDTSASYYKTINMTQGDYSSWRNIVECPKCGVAIFAKLKKYTEVIVNYKNNPENDMQVIAEREEIVKYERGD